MKIDKLTKRQKSYKTLNMSTDVDTRSSEQKSPTDDVWEDVKPRKKERKIPAFKPENGQFMAGTESKGGEYRSVESGIEKEKLFCDGYIQLKTGMLNSEQILAYFIELQNAAVKAHFTAYGENDNSYLQAQIKINILESKDTGKFGYANCYITNDPDNKMFFVLLGKGPKKDFPKEVPLEDGSGRKEIINFIETSWIEMTPEQMIELGNYMARRLAARKISQEEYDNYIIATELPDILEKWETLSPKLEKASEAEIRTILNDNIELLTNLASEIVNALPEEEEDRISTEFNDALSLANGSDIVSKINDLLPPVLERSRTATHHKITGERLFVENIAQSVNRHHLYIAKAPLWATEEELYNLFSPYNTMEGTFRNTYPCIKGFRTIENKHYPHIWFENNKDQNDKTAHIAFTNNGRPDAAFALAMMTKFDLNGRNAAGEELVQQQIVFCWADMKGHSSKKQYHQGYFPTKKTDFKPGAKFNYQSGGAYSNRPQPGRPQITQMEEKSKAPVEVSTVIDITSSKSSSVASGQWAKPLSKDEFLKDETGNIVPSLSFAATVKKITKRGYDPDRRDDGNLDVFY